MDKTKKLVSFRLPEDLLQDLRDRADIDGISVTELVARLLRQGLKESENDRIASLEAEIQDLRRANQGAGIMPTPIYTLLSQGAVNREAELELKERMNRLESLVEKALIRNQFDSPTGQERISRLEELVEKVLIRNQTDNLPG